MHWRVTIQKWKKEKREKKYDQQLTQRANSLNYNFNEFTQINQQFFITSIKELLKFVNIWLCVEV